MTVHESSEADKNPNIDLRLPDEKRAGTTWRPRRPSRLPLIVALITLVVLLVFIIQETTDLLGKKRRESRRRDLQLDKRVAERLADAGEYGEAARHLRVYANWGVMPPQDRARIYYRVGDYYLRAGEYAAALSAFYRSELTAGVGDLEQDIKAGKKRCFDMLGNTAGWEQELKRLTDVENTRPTEAETVVAEIDGRRITMLELDQLIEARVTLMLQQIARGAPPEQLAEQKSRFLKQFDTDEARLGFLRDYVAQQLLVREAIERGYHKQPDVIEILDQLRAGVLAEQVQLAEAEKATPTPSELSDYYEAHKAEFVEPEQAEISMIVLDDEAAAQAVIEELAGGADFAALAKQRSTDEATRDDGGELPGPVTRRAGVPGVGRQPELIGHIFALDEGKTSAAPLELDGTFYVFKVSSHTPERTKPYEQVEDTVRRQAFDRRQADLMNALIDRLMTKYQAAIHPGAFRAEAPQEPPAGTTQQ